MIASSFWGALSGFLLSALFVLFFKEASARWKFLTTKGVPSIGGVSMGLAFGIVLLLTGTSLAGLPREIKGIVIASAFMLVTGILDDHRELSVAQKFFVQLVAAAILVGFGVRTDFAYAGNLLNIAISLFWIIAITNAMNLLDVMDGLAGGTALVILSGFCVISAVNGDSLTFIVSAILGGAVLGFWIFNLPPAKVYMGNNGSHFLGLVLAALAITARYATLERNVALLTPLLLLGFPILDTLFLILMRVRKGTSAFNKSEDHIALRFLKKGYSKKRTLAAMMGWTLFFVAAGAMLSQASNLFGILILILAGLGSLVLIKKMSRVKV